MASGRKIVETSSGKSYYIDYAGDGPESHAVYSYGSDRYIGSAGSLVEALALIMAHSGGSIKHIS